MISTRLNSYNKRRGGEITNTFSIDSHSMLFQCIDVVIPYTSNSTHLLSSNVTSELQGKVGSLLVIHTIRFVWPVRWPQIVAAGWTPFSSMLQEGDEDMVEE